MPVSGPIYLTLDDDRYVSTASSRDPEYNMPPRARESASTYSVLPTGLSVTLDDDLYVSTVSSDT